MNSSTTQSRCRYDADDGIQAEASLLSAATIYGDKVCNLQDEKLGNIQDVMLDLSEGKIRYVIMASGGFMGMRDRLFAVPWEALKQDKVNKRFMLDVNADRLKNAPGFARDQWPNMADTGWKTTVDSYYAK